MLLKAEIKDDDCTSQRNPSFPKCHAENTSITTFVKKNGIVAQESEVIKDKSILKSDDKKLLEDELHTLFEPSHSEAAKGVGTITGSNVVKLQAILLGLSHADTNLEVYPLVTEEVDDHTKPSLKFTKMKSITELGKLIYTRKVVSNLLKNSNIYSIIFKYEFDKKHNPQLVNMFLNFTSNQLMTLLRYDVNISLEKYSKFLTFPWKPGDLCWFANSVIRIITLTLLLCMLFDLMIVYKLCSTFLVALLNKLSHDRPMVGIMVLTNHEAQTPVEKTELQYLVLDLLDWLVVETEEDDMESLVNAIHTGLVHGVIDTVEKWTYFICRLACSQIYCLRYLNIFNLVNDDRADLSKLMLVPVPEVLDEHELVPGRVLWPPILPDARLVLKSCEYMINNPPWKHRIYPPHIYPSYACYCCCLGNVDHLLLQVLALPVPAIMATQVDEREHGWLCSSFCLGRWITFFSWSWCSPCLLSWLTRVSWN